MRVLAHGIGGRQDLPIPWEFALAGAAAALVVSFVLLGVAWRRSRFRGRMAGRALPEALQAVLDAAWLRWALRGAGLLAYGWTVAALIFGRADARSPAPGALYVLLWVGVPLASLLAGPLWRQLNPLRTLHLLLTKLTGARPQDGLLPYPARWGHWPGVLTLGTFVWLELVAPARASIPVVGLFIAVYSAGMLIGAALYGSRWFDHADCFEIYSTLAAHLAPIGRRNDGRLVLRNPFNGLDGLPTTPGVTAFVLLLLGSTAYDGLSNAPGWIRLVQDSGLPPVLPGTLGLAASVAVIALAYALATLACGRTADATRRGLPTRFAHSIIPIALGYIVAHYYSLLMLEGQNTLILAGDPLGTGADLLGLASRTVDGTLVTPAIVATLQVGAVVAGHVLGVVAAHDRAVRLYPAGRAVRGQTPLLLLMVGYTLTGLTLLFAG